MEPTGYQYTSDKRKRYYDYTLFFLVVALILFGILMIGSISSFNAAKYVNDAKFYTKRQIRYAVIGIAGMLAVSFIDYRLYAIETPRRKWPILLILAYGLIVVMEFVVIAIGHTDSELSGATNGAARWIAIGPFKLQPGEFAKLFMIVIAAYAICKLQTVKNRMFALAVIVGMLLVITVLAAKESMTTGIVLAAILAGMIFVGSKKKLIFALAAAGAGVGAWLIVRYADRAGASADQFRWKRIYDWIHLKDESNVGQVKQGLYALASGGLFGKGLGSSAQKLGHIPEVHTDMIFSCVVEELGLVGGAAVILLFALLIWRIAIVAINAPDLYGTMVCYGVMIHIGLQVCINIGVVTGTIPVTGVTLPFISYGGSSFLVLCAECGLVLNVSRNIGYRKRVLMKEYETEEESSASENVSKEQRKAFPGLPFRKIKDDRKKRKPDRKTRGGTSPKSEASRGKNSGNANKKAGERSRVKEEKPTMPQPGAYKMDIVLGQPSGKNRDGE